MKPTGSLDADQPELQRPDAASRRARRGTTSPLIPWLLVAIWIGVIQTLGGEGFSHPETSRFLGPLLRFLFPDAGPDGLEAVQFAIRKSAHVIEYGILAVLAWRACRRSVARPAESRRTREIWMVTAAMAIVVVVAIFDESSQATSSNRMGAASDVALDSIGGALALLAARFVPAGWIR